jgi:hypothetical protein
MKWNAAKVGAASLVMGVLGFSLGKLPLSYAKLDPESEALLARAKQASEQRISERAAAGSAAGRSSRSKSAANSINEKFASLEEIIRGENALNRGRAMLSWIDSLAPSEFEAAVAHFRSLGLTEERPGEYAMLLTAWAELDPIAALAYTTENTRGSMATDTVITAWASRDPESAILWAKANHKGDGANPYMVGIIRSIAGQNMRRATELLVDMPFSSERASALRSMLPHLLKQGTEAAKSWVDSLSDPRLKDGARARLAEYLAKNDPAYASALLLESPGEASTRSLDVVYREWAKSDPKAAEANLQKIPKGQARTSILRGMVSSLTQENPQLGVDLMDRYPDEVDDRMVLHFAWNAFDKDPSLALTQAGRIQEQGLRERMQRRGLSAWRERDAQAAQAWEEKNLPRKP